MPCVIADTITPDADITGLVTYLPLTLTVSEWAETVLEVAKLHRRDTSEDFRKHGYDIESVAKEFVSLMGMSSDDSGC